MQTSLTVDGETDCRDSLLTNSMQTSLTVDGETDCCDSLLTNSMEISLMVDGETDCVTAYMGGFKGEWSRRTPPLSEVNHQNYKYK